MVVWMTHWIGTTSTAQLLIVIGMRRAQIVWILDGLMKISTTPQIQRAAHVVVAVTVSSVNALRAFQTTGMVAAGIAAMEALISMKDVILEAFSLLDALTVRSNSDGGVLASQAFAPVCTTCVV
jgi:hypothetical protein